MKALKDFIAEIGALAEDLAVPMRALVVAVIGVFLAWLWFHSYWFFAALLSLGITALGIVLYWTGKSLFPDNPVRGLSLMEFFVISPAMVAAAATGIIIVVTVNLSAPKSATDETKQMLTALTTAITAFLTSGFIAWIEDRDDSSLADRIKSVFQDKYKRYNPNKTPEPGVKYFRAESTGERWVYSNDFKGVSGWGGKARRKRAKGIALEMRTGASDPDATVSAQHPVT